MRTKVTELTNKVIEFGKKMENDDTLSKGTGILENLYQATERYNKKELYVLVSGEVKTGKSSLINSILGEEICTVDSGVCTNTNTMIRYGETEKITVYFAQDENGETPEPITIAREEIKAYVSERKNKNNKKNVRLISVEVPNKHLQSGLVLIDSPGLGSLNPLHAATTFSIAPIADVVVLVAKANSELKDSEVSYIKQLLDCSKCKMVIHALTHSDCGDPEVVMNKNIEHLQSVKDWKEGELECCMLSNTNYQEYLRKNIKDISVTGFDKFFSLLEKVENNVEKIMAENQLLQVLSALQNYGNTLNVLLQSFSSPEKIVEKRQQIESAKERLEEIIRDFVEWDIELKGMIKKLTIQTFDKIKTNYKEIEKSIEQKLHIYEYIKSPNKLGGIISAELINKNAILQDYLGELFTNVYIDLKNRSKLLLIQQELNPINPDEQEYSINEAHVDKIRLYYSESISNVMIGSVAGAVVGGIIGGVIGTFFAPGVGTLAGAEIGAAIASSIGTIIGGVTAFFRGREKVKEQKRQQIMRQVGTILRESQDKLTTQIQLIITNGETELCKIFRHDVETEKTRCNNILKGLDADSQKRKVISDLKRECELNNANASKLYKESHQS